MGEEAWGGDCDRRANTELRKAAGTRVGEDMKLRGLVGLVGDFSTLVGKTLGGGEKGVEVGDLAVEDRSSAASSLSRGTGDSVGEGLLTGERLWAAMNSFGLA